MSSQKNQASNEHRERPPVQVVKKVRLGKGRGMKPATQPVTHTQSFTPGPWRVDESFAIPAVIASCYPKGMTCVAVVYGPGEIVSRIPPAQSTTEQHANARLIAAAPELLEALKDVTERLALSLQVFGNSPEVVNVNVANARAAIAKATGAEGTRP
jgi:hypothetical protein